MRKFLLFVVVAVMLATASAIPALACNPNPLLMEDTCYASCANWAEYLSGECAQNCHRQYCQNFMGVPQPCENGYETCMAQCDTNECNSLAECEDYCHDW